MSEQNRKTKLDMKIGCCGFPLAREKYYREFKTVEIQETFYNPPKLETVTRWRESAPDDFEFTIKAWQLITHDSGSPTYRKLKFKISEKDKVKYGFFKPTDEVFRAWEKIDKIALLLNTHIVLFQTPASFTPDKINQQNICKFFKGINRKNFKFVWEPRGNWEEKTVRDLCEELKLIHCVDPFKNKPVWGDYKYFRLHGAAGYRYVYSEPELLRLKKMQTEDKRVYIMFNNTNMWEDALRFKKIWQEN